MKRHAGNGIMVRARRIVAGLLCLVLFVGTIPAITLEAVALSWVQETQDYLNRIVEWGVMRGDVEGNLDPNRQITRAEFATMINRAYGYNKPGPTPFTDVKSTDWFADDVATAYNMGYMKGVSETACRPGDYLTREQAVVILGRNMMLTPTSGEVLAFTDGREFSQWSRGWIQACADVGVAIGYEDGTFQPQRNITRGEVAAMLVRAIGTLVKDKGETTLGQVAGNVTINTSNATLKDTVIAGDLYLTGGIGLGDVLLDNVTVLGKIVASGAGEGNEAESSIILRNSKADEMVVDSISNQFVSVRVQGNTQVGETKVRTHAYLEDLTGQDLGMKIITLDSEAGTGVQLAGNIKKVVNRTPASILTIARGVADQVSVDESAVGSQLQILNGARVKDLDLDVGTAVGGNNMGVGDIDNLHVYSEGSTVEQLPNTIDVRPGITATVNGTVMDTGIAAESSQDPQLLSGYPAARNVAPTTADAVFSANKAGTVYWAVSAVADGSVSKQELLNPPAYSKKVIASGKVNLSASKTESTVKLPKLVTDGAYYITAMLVDNRGQESPVKVTAFTTPDNTVPAFANSYPKMEQITSSSGQVAVMATKTCQLYYAILPKGSTAPTVDNFRTGAVSGNLGYGVRNAVKNTIDLFNVNSMSLREQTEYDVYLCLYDADGGQSSAVKKLTFKTSDGTPPVLTGPTQKPQRTSVQLTASMNEAGTFYWVVVEEGKPYPDPLPGQTGTPALNSAVAKNAVMMGIGGLKSGSARATANRNFTVNITGLAEHTAYDLYYLAVDSAGNSREVQKIRINTVDEEPPKVSLEFTSTSDEAGTKPRANTGLRVVFNESIQTYEENEVFLDTYTAMANETNANKKAILKQEWGVLVHSHITLMMGEANLTNRTEVPLKGDNPGSVWVDYSEVVVKQEDKNVVFIFENGKAVQMVSGGKYHFRISEVKDLANNDLKPRADYRMGTFQIAIAEVKLTKDDPKAMPDSTSEYVRPDMWFQVKPDENARVDENVYFDVLLWSASSFSFILYGRVLDQSQNPVTTGTFPLLGNVALTQSTPYGNGWVRIGDSDKPQNMRPGSSSKAGMSITGIGGGGNTQALTFSKLKEFFDKGYIFEFAIQRAGTETEYKTWGDEVKLDVQVVAGAQSDLRSLANSVNENSTYLGRVDSIGTPGFFVDRQFEVMDAPEFSSSFPSFTLGINGDKEVRIDVSLNLPGDVYFVLAAVDADNKKQDLETKDENGNLIFPDKATGVPPASGDSWEDCPVLSSPKEEDILPDWNFSTDDIKYGMISVGSGRAEKTVKGLKPSTTYFAYFVIQSQANPNVTSRVLLYQFTTLPERKPIITLTYTGAGEGNYKEYQHVSIQTATDAELNWVMVNPSNDVLPSFLTAKFETYAKAGFNASNYDDKRDGVSGSFSVLDALLVRAGDGKGSVFDEYAKDADDSTIRADVKGYISQQSDGNGRIGWGKMTFAARNDTISPQNAQIADSKLPSASQCFCLAVAETATGVLAFQGIENIRRQNRDEPDITSVTTNIKSASGSGDTYNATITLYFKPNIRITGDDRNTKYLYAAAPTDGVATGTYELIDKLLVKDLSTGAAVSVAFPTTGRVTNMLQFSFTGISAGDSVTLFGGYTITNEFGDGFASPLIIQFRDTLPGGETGEIQGRPNFVITWNGSKCDGNRYDNSGLLDLDA